MKQVRLFNVQQSLHETSLEKSIDNVHKHNKTTAAAATTNSNNDNKIIKQ
jgi:hypothetical protein